MASFDLRLHGRLARELIQFGTVGVAGFLANTAIVYAIRGVFGLYIAGLLAWVFAATITWFLNRNWTYRDRSRAPLQQQWALFLFTNSIGFALYYLTYVSLITSSHLCAAQPIIAIFLGAIAGMLANFSLARRFVFQ